MSRTGSILEAYWNNPKLGRYVQSKFNPRKISPFHLVFHHFIKHPHLQAVNSFDCESTDELGIHGIKSPSKLETSAKSSQKDPFTTSDLITNTNHPDRSNTLNGLLCM